MNNLTSSQVHLITWEPALTRLLGSARLEISAVGWLYSEILGQEWGKLVAYVDPEKFHAFLKSKIKRPRCHVCRKGPLYYTSELYTIEMWDGLPGIEKKPIMSVVPLNCDNCGAVAFINPVRMGFDVRPQDDDFDNAVKYL